MCKIIDIILILENHSFLEYLYILPVERVILVQICPQVYGDSAQVISPVRFSG